MSTHINHQDVFVVVDVQNDFCLGGALAVPGGDSVIPVIQHMAPAFRHIILTQDWHPPGHISFASSHSGKKPFDQMILQDRMETLWPDHCVQGTAGAAIHPDLQLPEAELILRKGYRKELDSYSAFFENDHITPTGLGGYLRDRGLNRIFFAGLAYDYCVGFSAIDARRLNFSAIILRDACGSINTTGPVARIEAEFQRCGVLITESADLI